MLTSEATMLVVGDVMLDAYIETNVRRISPEAPIPVATVQHRWSSPGGAANVARNLTHIGCQTVLVGACGDDQAGISLRELLHADGITADLISLPGRPTTTKTRILAAKQQILRLDAENATGFSPDSLEMLWDRLARHAANSACVIISDYNKGLFCRMPDGDSLCQRLIALCSTLGVPTFVDPKTDDWARYVGADCVTPNLGEFHRVAGDAPEDIAGLDNLAQVLMHRHQLGHMVLTRSEHGVVLFQPQAPAVSVPAEAREVADVTGAGDTVIAVLAACIARGLDWLTAVHAANAAAGIVVGKIGAAPLEAVEMESVLRGLRASSDALADMTGKIYTYESLLWQVRQWKNTGMRIVFTNGCFDLLHIGHVRLIQEAARQGDKLIVAVNSDTSVRRLKGAERPVQTENARALVLAALENVAAVIIFSEMTPLSLIEAVTPDVLVKGGDYTVDRVIGASHVIQHGGRVHLAALVDGYSTSNIIAKFAS